MIFQEILNIIKTPLGLLEIINVIIISVCTFAIFISIIINFTESSKNKVKKEKKSIVETGTMFLFFFVFYLIIRFRLGVFEIDNIAIKLLLIFIGWFLIIIGCIVNINGRLALGKNWANQIKIYQDHTFIRKGVYSIVRHPLYASLIWMFYGGCLVFSNYLALLFNTIIFVPFMYYRAKQEEALLTKTFKEYKLYKKEVGIFFPKIKFL